MKRVTQLLVLLVLTALGLAVAPAPADLAPKGKESIAQERIAVCTEGLRLAVAQYQVGLVTVDVVATWSRRMVDSQRSAGLPKDQLAATIRKHLEFLTKFEETVAHQHKAGLCTPLDLRAASYSRLEAEQWLAEAEGR